MSQYNTANNAYVSNNTVTEVIVVANSTGGIINTFGVANAQVSLVVNNAVVSASNRMPVDIGVANLTFSGNVAISTMVNPVGTAALATAQITVTTSATIIANARTGASGTGRVSATLYNFSANTVYVGNSAVTTTTGVPIPFGAVLTLNTTAAIYGVTTSGTTKVSVLESF